MIGQSLLKLGFANELVIRLFFSRITVTFNVNNSIPPNFEEEVDQGQQKPAEGEVSERTMMVSEMFGRSH